MSDSIPLQPFHRLPIEPKEAFARRVGATGLRDGPTAQPSAERPTRTSDRLALKLFESVTS